MGSSGTQALPAAGRTRRVSGIDVGGTFTDIVVHESGPDGARVRIGKVPTTLPNQTDGVLAAIDQAGVVPAKLELLIHGTTATTNALLERKIARVGLITTMGFRDTLELGRRTRPRPYGMTGTFAPLVPRDRRIEVAERMDAQGNVVCALDEAAVAAAARVLLGMDCESVVIHFLHAYANPEHELKAGGIVRALWPNGYVTLGHELLSEYREYERGTTASVNAAVQPILDRYVRRLQGELEGRGFARDLLVMNGNGGTVSSRLVARDAAKTVMSGPASGVIAAAATLAQSDVSNAITYDMGGTSTDVALIHGGVPEVSSELAIAYGLPIHVPMVDVRSVGAGGGSIASLNAAGMLKVGPESAGSTPGPICYRRGGTEPTITDANLVLGRLDPAGLTAVEGTVDVEAVRAAIRDRLARPLGFSIEDAAAAVLRLANTHMAGAIRLVSLSRGYDPRDFVLFAFGGAGPLHAVAIARELGIPEVLVPVRPGLTNALGCLVADLRQDSRQHRQRAACHARYGRRQSDAGSAARPGRGHQRGGAGRDRRDRGAARRRHAVPRADASDPRGHSLARGEPRGAAGPVRGGLLRPLPRAPAGDPRRAGQPGHVGDRQAARPGPGDAGRHRRGAGPHRRARALCRRPLALRRRLRPRPAAAGRSHRRPRGGAAGGCHYGDRAGRGGGCGQDRQPADHGGDDGMTRLGGVRPCGSDPIPQQTLEQGVRPAGSDPSEAAA